MFELREYRPIELKSTPSIVNEALTLCREIESTWNLGKKFDSVQTYTLWRANDYWAARVSTHTNISFLELEKTILKDHTENEVKYQDIVTSATKLPVPVDISEWESASVVYKFPFPLKPRTMVIWLYATMLPELPDGRRRFIVITFPREAPNGACYVSIEMVEELSDSRVKWVMAQTSNAGGWVPQWMQRLKIESSIAQDIPFFEKWLKHQESNDE